MYEYTLYQWLAFFYSYCFIGWIFESVYVSLKSHRFINRGFLKLPLLPLYGTGAVMMLWVSLPFQDNILMIYVSGFFAATLLEYITGYVMECLFKMQYWDYSSKRFNLNGYVCLSSSIAWGFLTVFLTEVLHQLVNHIITGLFTPILLCLLAVITVVFTYDCIESTKAAIDLGKALEAASKIKREIQEMQLQLYLLKAETVKKAESIKDGFSELKDEEILSIRKKMESLSARHQELYNHLSLRRQNIFRNNPTVSSHRFGEAVKDLKDFIGTLK